VQWCVVRSNCLQKNKQHHFTHFVLNNSLTSKLLLASLAVFASDFWHSRQDPVMFWSTRRGFTIRLKRLKPRAPDSISSISVSIIFVFFWFKARFFIMPLTKEFYIRLSAKDWSECWWAFSFSAVANWLLLHIMCGTKCLNPYFRLHGPVRYSINM